jgi:hypothetical protein
MTAAGRNLVRNNLELLFASRQQDYSRALTRQLNRNRAADAAGGARDE